MEPISFSFFYRKAISSQIKEQILGFLKKEKKSIPKNDDAKKFKGSFTYLLHLRSIKSHECSNVSISNHIFSKQIEEDIRRIKKQRLLTYLYNFFTMLIKNIQEKRSFEMGENSQYTFVISQDGDSSIFFEPPIDPGPHLQLSSEQLLSFPLSPNIFSLEEKKEIQRMQHKINRTVANDVMIYALKNKNPKNKIILRKIEKLKQLIKQTGQFIQSTFSRSYAFIILYFKLIWNEQKRLFNFDKLFQKIEIRRSNKKLSKNPPQRMQRIFQQKLQEKLNLMFEALKVFILDEEKGINLMYTKGQKRVHPNVLGNMRICQNANILINQYYQNL